VADSAEGRLRAELEVATAAAAKEASRFVADAKVRLEQFRPEPHGSKPV
jgi:hypothetical protein